MAEVKEVILSGSYPGLYAIPLGKEMVKRGILSPGKHAVTIEGIENFTAEGTLSQSGVLTGMAKLYTALKLREGHALRLRIDKTEDGDPAITVLQASTQSRPYTFTETQNGYSTTTSEAAVTNNLFSHTLSEPVFKKKQLRHMYIEPFRAENLNHWEPETETDVYMAFGVLQIYTNYEYCCGASKAMLMKLGANYSDTSKPDAILIDRTTSEYVMAEWKMVSSAFAMNHHPEDVDVLICWRDDEADKTKLPQKVIALHGIARKAAEIAIS